MTDRSIAVHTAQITPTRLTSLSIPDMVTLGQQLVKTGFLPQAVNTPEKAMAIMLKGQELSIPPMYALSNIVVVNGKPSCSAELMLALIQRNHGQRAIRVKASDDAQCTVEYRLDGWGDTQTYSFTIQQAEQAGLFKNAVWKSYPAAMLRARCISAVARMAFPGSIAGMYVPGELGEAVTVNDDGEVLSASAVIVNQDTGEITDHTDGSTQAQRRLHAVAKEYGIDHDMLHRWAVAAVGTDSLSDVPPRTLNGMSEKLQIEGFADRFIEKYGAPSPDESDTADHPEPLFSDEDEAELNAAADRVQVATKARA